VQRADGVLERPVTARLEDLGTDGAVLSVGFWTDSRRSDFKDTSSAVRLAIVEALRAAGASLPEPEHWRGAEGAPRRGASSGRPVETAAP
jgi:small-conductance mechanosensitive channel